MLDLESESMRQPQSFEASEVGPSSPQCSASTASGDLLEIAKSGGEHLAQSIKPEDGDFVSRSAL
jgi:hypothetical protein